MGRAGGSSTQRDVAFEGAERSAVVRARTRTTCGPGRRTSARRRSTPSDIMQGQSQQQAYDRGITIFSPDGRLYQVEYAPGGGENGTASVGVRAEDGVVLAADKRARSPLMEPESIEKLHKADDHVGVASAGHVADARQLIDFARRQAQINRLRYGEAIGIETLTKNITDHIQQYTQIGGARPFGVALIVGGIENGEPRLFETDPSGTPYEWQALSIGSDRATSATIWRRSTRGLSTDEAVALALDTLAQSNDGELSSPRALASPRSRSTTRSTRSDQPTDRVDPRRPRPARERERRGRSRRRGRRRRDGRRERRRRGVTRRRAVCGRTFRLLSFHCSTAGRESYAAGDRPTTRAEDGTHHRLFLGYRTDRRARVP